jgi:hypothetical protein
MFDHCVRHSTVHPWNYHSPAVSNTAVLIGRVSHGELTVINNSRHFSGHGRGSASAEAMVCWGAWIDRDDTLFLTGETTMIRRSVLLGIVILVGLAAVAQEFPRAEVGVMYSYTRFSPSARYAPNLNLNGGGGSVTFNLTSYLGIKAELMGSGASKATFTIPKGDPIAPGGANVKVSGNLFSYLFGPQIRIPAGKARPYFHALFGGAHTSVFANAESACSGVCQPIAPAAGSAKPSQNAFGMAFGGGLDIPVGHVVGIRVAQVDYLMTRFSNRFATNNQNNFRYSAGIVFNFGH